MAGLRDRLLTRASARAMTAPSSILLLGAATAGAIVAGAPLAAAAAVGVAAWAARVAVALPRGPRPEPIDPRLLDPPWQHFVREALQAQERFAGALRRVRAGPLRERLEAISARVDDGVRECWRIARHGQDLQRALADLDPVHLVEQRLAAVQAGHAGPPDAPAAAAMRRSLEAQLASTRRIAATVASTQERLRLLDVRLDEAVTRAVELALSAGDPVAVGTGAGGLHDDVEAVVAEMEALRQALETTGGATAAHPS